MSHPHELRNEILNGKLILGRKEFGLCTTDRPVHCYWELIICLSDSTQVYTISHKPTTNRKKSKFLSGKSRNWELWSPIPQSFETRWQHTKQNSAYRYNLWQPKIKAGSFPIHMKSQNSWGWKGSLEFIWSNAPAQKKSHLEQVAQDCVQLFLCKWLSSLWITSLSQIELNVLRFNQIKLPWKFFASFQVFPFY